MPPSNIPPQLLEKYLRNQCTEQEKERVEAWYASLDGKPDYLDSLPEPEQQHLQDETFLMIQSQLEPDEKPLVKTFPLAWLAGLAASLLLVVGLYSVYRYSATRPASVTANVEKKVLDSRVHFVNHKPHPVRHQLPDGSSVWMHSEASIKYPKEFDRDKRLVSFSGEGFFDIKKDQTRPFSIQSGEMRIKVLGTSFNVNAPVARTVFRISVVTGRVEVRAPDRQQKEQLVVLKPQQQAVFETESKRLVSSTIPSQIKKEIYEPVTIVFSNTPINQVVKRLEKRFNVQIKLANPKIGSCLFNADFEKQPLPLIMEMLCTALDATYTMSGKVIVMDGLPCE
ncbi:FecR family protein [Larkinella knui]|uniref:FecR family protein n=1 Tax=Larkinella knui TaxID=2025310 RepID=A0A3P1CAB7_9BACT|nr:FecR family protein [Larkinella knui]RRB10247.1 FecR family protein [Larkinella knui]